MNADKLKAQIAQLPEQEQEAIAQIALINLKNRSRLESLARPTIWPKLDWIFPVVFSVGLLGFRTNLSDFLPFIVTFLLFWIHTESSMIHRRIDAIYELMKTAQTKNNRGE